MSYLVDITDFFVTNVYVFRLVMEVIKATKARDRQMYRTNRNWEVIRLLLQLKYYDGEYPTGLYSTRRSDFVNLLYRVLLFFS